MLVVLINALMGLPPVVVGLIVYLLLSRSGPLGVLGLLYTPTAMIIAQVILITPLVAALSLQVLEEIHREYDEFFRSLNLSSFAKLKNPVMGWPFWSCDRWTGRIWAGDIRSWCGNDCRGKHQPCDPNNDDVNCS